MIDLLKLSIPFKTEHLITVKSADKRGGTYIDLEQVAKISGLRLSARAVEFEINGDLTVTGLTHPFDSLPTHYSWLAMKVYAGSFNRFPCVELKASPAKLLQGHNVFGSTDLALCGAEFFYNLAISLPELYDMLYIEQTLIDRMDVTYSAKVENEFISKQVIYCLRNVSNGQTKRTKAQEHETTVTWNEGSRHRILVAYLKHPELLKQVDELRREIKKKPDNDAVKRRFAIISNSELQNFSSNLVRFEARLVQRFIRSFGIPMRFWDAVKYQIKYDCDGKSLIADLWSFAFRDLLEALEGNVMNIYCDDEILELLKMSFHTITPKGDISYSKALRLFGFYRRLVNEGYDAVSQAMARNSFWRHVTDLMSIGISKAQLQNLSADKSNIVPLLKVINVDFSHQRTDWYVEPVSVFDRAENIYDFKRVINA
ncbi:phage/plasmid replication protein, II/X family [Candidatus Symbiopectobacterium endolongispinus]|nr:phage/plasmid replication protein, II/X family [Candidatus Symbiopectobacterium endolongispinus]MBT9430794.1 DNA replication protein [Candidatus Symbiopectobacterium endolongispinus]